MTTALSRGDDVAVPALGQSNFLLLVGVLILITMLLLLLTSYKLFLLYLLGFSNCLLILGFRFRRLSTKMVGILIIRSQYITI
jgi:hypothetical protein